MRKIELRKFIIIVLFIAVLSIVFMGIPFIVKVVGFNIEAIFLIMGIVLFWLVFIVGGILVNKIFNLYYKHDNEKNMYYRDIPKDYTPAIASLIYDNTFESSLDIPATMISLVGKKVLLFDENLNLKILNKEKVDLLEEHEKYLCNCIAKNKEIDPDEFRKMVVNDAVSKNLIKKTSKSPIKTSTLFFILMGLMLIMMLFHDYSFYTPVEIILALMMFIGVPAVATIDKNNSFNEYENTFLGKKEKKKLNGLKNFLKDFSTLDEKEEKYVLLWDEYLAYAYMFGINNKIFNKFMNDKKYRKLFKTEYDI